MTAERNLASTVDSTSITRSAEAALYIAYASMFRQSKDECEPNNETSEYHYLLARRRITAQFWMLAYMPYRGFLIQ